MRRLISSIGCALALVAAPAMVQAQTTKTVSGAITSIAQNSITVKAAGGQEMTFAIDSKTEVIAPGGSTKSRAAKAEGKAGPVVTELLKEDQAVQVTYHEKGMHAARIRAIASVPAEPKPAGPKAQTVSGEVTAITGNSLTIKGAKGDSTFSVDEKSTVSGTGIGTASKKLIAEGKKPSLVELLHEGDIVAVTYHDMGSTKHASVVRITRPKK